MGLMPSMSAVDPELVDRWRAANQAFDEAHLRVMQALRAALDVHPGDVVRRVRGYTHYRVRHVYLHLIDRDGADPQPAGHILGRRLYHDGREAVSDSFIDLSVLEKVEV